MAMPSGTWWRSVGKPVDGSVKRVIGSGLIRRKITTVPATAENLGRMARNARSAFDWSSTSDDIRRFVARHWEEVRSASPMEGYKPHEEFGWYIETLHFDLEIVDDHVRRGDASSAASASLRLGWHFEEMRWKFNWEHEALEALDTRERRQAGGASTRKGSDAERVTAWRKHRAAGATKTDADYLAAKDTRCGESTVRKARVQWEKAAATSD